MSIARKSSEDTSMLYNHKTLDEITYWRAYLADAPLSLELPTDYADRDTSHFHLASHTLIFPSQLTNQLRAQQYTISTYLLMSFLTLLHFYTNQEDLIIGISLAGSATSGPHRTAIDNCLPLRYTFAQNPPLITLLEQLQAEVEQVSLRSGFALERVLSDVVATQSHKNNWPYQVRFAFSTDWSEHLDANSMQAVSVLTSDLVLRCIDYKGELTATLEYNAALFAETSIVRMVNHWQNVLTALLTEPSQHLATLSMLSEEEYQRIVYDWNETVKAYPYEQSLQQLLEAQVERSPDAPALTFEQTTLTYEELNARANQLAHHLRALGVGPEVLVGVYMERSLEMVVALLGIVKAGGAYVPLDPTYPAERIEFMLKDIAPAEVEQAVVLLTQARFANLLLSENRHVLCLDTEWGTIAGEESVNPLCMTKPEHAAYVIYTSGSTGKPKGVINRHRSICNRLLWMQDIYQLTEQDSVLQKTPFSFDVSVWEFFWPLLSGARLVMARPEGHKDSVYLMRVIQEQQITTLHFVPSMLQIFVMEPGLEQCSSLRQVMCSGEALPYELQERFFARHPAKLHNLYGPTEAAIDVTFWECQRQSQSHIVPIGHPIANTQLYILNRYGQPVPVGVPGELYIGGVGVARGYLHRAELTQERFVPDVFSQDPQARLYRTGDLARYAPGGEIEYLGRLDHQIKLRGFRIELGEIEATLGHYSALREVVVVVREDTPGDKRLVAYIVWQQGQRGHIQELQQYMLQHVPAFMVPAIFVELDELPLSPNGKVDRRALPVPAMANPGLRAEKYVAPSTPTEQTIARIWSQVLGIEYIGLHDTFFALGGHSLHAAQVITQLRERMQITLPLRALFEAPTIAQLVKHIEQVSTQHQAIVLPAIRPIARVWHPVSASTEQEEAVLMPLSFAQQRLWFMDQLTSGTPVYNIPATMHISGDLDMDALRMSLYAMQQRHEVLRTHFVVVHEQPQQVIRSSLSLVLKEVDMHLETEEEKQQAFQHVLEANARQGFDVLHGPLWRVVVYHLAPQQHVLSLVMHHIISDGWTIGIFFRELEQLYTSFEKKKQPDLQALPVQYADFAHWQREVQTEERLAEHLTYWQRQLANAPARLELPTDRPRPVVPTLRGETYTFALSRELADAIKATSQRESVTPYMMLVAAFQLLLHRYSGQDDIIIGSAIADREHAEVQEVMGLFLNTLALRTRFAETTTVHELLQYVRNMVLDAHAHQNLPFEQLVQALAIERIAGQHPLFQVAIQLDPPTSASTSTWQLTRMAVGTGMSKFDLSLEFDEQPDTFIGHIEYSTDLFDASTIARMVGHWQHVLTQMVAHPELNLTDIPLLTQHEYEQLLQFGDGVQREYPRDRGVHQLFEGQVALTPERIAVTYAETQLTYSELNARANQLAHHLRTLGVGRDTLVGLCLERSLAMVVAVLGILKAGGAYLPLDPTYPTERIAFMLEDAHAPVLITESTLVSQLPPHEGHTIYMDQDREHLQLYSQENLDLLTDGEQLAYVIYTSGSTGKPKGVQIAQRALVNFLLSMREYPGIDATDRLLAVTTLSFDIAGLELYLPLLVGAHLVIASRDDATNGVALAALLEREEISVMQATPITWRMLLASGWTGRVGLKALCGGEGLPIELARQLLLKVGALYNMYGPTETTIWSTCSKIQLDDQSISVGRPIANTQIRILDKYRQPVPIGIPGELYIGGDGLAHGYLHRPELTAERFPFCTINNEQVRLYRTGDLARLHVDGNLELIGRVDHQVKLRGYRIELGEIEAILEQHSTVQQVVSIVREDEPGNQRLVAYVVPQVGISLEIQELRALAQEHLPAYMVPSVFVVLEQLPQTPNGKVDRKALPVPDGSTQEEAELYVAPRSALETALVAIWSQVLGRERIGVCDSFFALGGHSLLAMQVAARVQTTLQMQLPLRLFFEKPTIAQQAEYLDQAALKDAVISLPVIQRNSCQQQADGTLLFPVSFAQRGLWLIDQLDEQTTAYNLQATMRLRQELHVEVLQKSLDTVVMRHEALRTTFVPQDGQPIQVVSPASVVPLQRTHLEHITNEEREAELQRLITSEVQRPFDLLHGPLFRASLFHLECNEHLLLLTMHHSISDGWSLNVILRELAMCYSAYNDGEEPHLLDVSVQMGDFAAWQQQYIQDEVLTPDLHFWKQTLAGAPAVLELPTDYPRPSQPTHKGTLYRFTLPVSLSKALKQFSQRENVSLYMTLTTAFLLLLERYSGQQDILLGTTSAGRGQAEIDMMVGYCINTLVLRNDLSGDPSVRDLLARVRENVLAAHAHQRMPFERLVQELQPDRSLGQSPLFQVFLTVDPPLAESVADWDLRQENVPTGAAMFDLSLELVDHPHYIEGQFEYSLDLFAERTIAQMAGHWQRLLEAMVADPEQCAGHLAMLSEAERQQLLYEWNDTQASYPDEMTIHGLFEEQVERTREAIALVDVKESLTYRDLNSRANQLAHYLRRQGITAETRVGVALERSCTMIVALLAILKAGGAYVPLDPTFPQERLDFMLQDAEVSLLLTQEKYLSTLPIGNTHVCCLDRDWVQVAKEETKNLCSETTSTALAYLLYTSGSTGKPKGVLGTHRASVNRFQWMWEQYPFADDEVGAQKTTLTFVDAVWEIFGPLLQGIKLVLIPEHVVKEPQLFLEQLAQHKVSRLVLVPSLLRVLLESEPRLQTRVPSLRYWICSGETLSLELVRQFQQQLPDSHLLNLYGSSEVAADATYYEVPGQTEQVLIGRPIANMRAYLLDAQKRLVPVGVPGELYIGGDGVARGYHQRPELTEAVFLNDPLHPDSQQRFFKTGDWARYLPEGQLAYLGRIDHQVKVRGMRLELGEIESVLSQHKAVREAVVALHSDSLVAYVVGKSEQQITQQELREHVNIALPAYMVPAFFVILDALPLTPNGKVNRRALPAPTNADWQDVEGSVEAQTLLQRQLVEIWEELLNVHPISICDNFFALGGHSLLAARMMAQVQRISGRSLPLSTLFKSPTIERLAESLQTEVANDTRTPVVPVQASGSERPFFFLHGDWNGKAFYSLKLSHTLGVERPFYLLEPYIYTGLEVIPTLEEVAASHIKAMRTIQPEGPYVLGGWCNGAMIAYEMARQLHEEGEVVEKLIMMDPGSAPRFSSLLYKGIQSLSAYLPLNKKLQEIIFFRALHAYEYVRLWNYRQRLLEKSRIAEGRDPEEIELPHPNFKWIFLPKEKLHENYNSLFCWLSARYTVGPHQGKLAVFWAKEDSAGRRKFWTQQFANRQDIDVYEIEGNHLTSRTQHIHSLADALRTSLKQ